MQGRFEHGVLLSNVIISSVISGIILVSFDVGSAVLNPFFTRDILVRLRMLIMLL